jgi:hypothetical protein
MKREELGKTTRMRISEDTIAFLLTAALAVFAVVGLVSYVTTTLK